MNATSLTGASYTSVATSSGVEFDVAATAFTGGEVLYLGFLPNSNDREMVDVSQLFGMISKKLRRSAFTGTLDTLTIVAVNEAGGSTNVRASMTWREVR